MLQSFQLLVYIFMYT